MDNLLSNVKVSSLDLSKKSFYEILRAGLENKSVDFLAREKADSLNLSDTTVVELIKAIRKLFDDNNITVDTDVYSLFKYKMIATPIEVMGFGGRVTNCLKRANIYDMETLLNYPREKIKAFSNIGENTYNEIFTRVDMWNNGELENYLKQYSSVIKNKEKIPMDDNRMIITVDSPMLNYISLEELELSNRSYNALYREGYTYIGDLKGLSFDNLMDIRGIGTDSIEEIVSSINEYIENPTYNTVTLENAADIGGPFFESSKFCKLFKERIEEIMLEHSDCANLYDIRNEFGFDIPEIEIKKQLDRLVENGTVILVEDGYKFNYPSIYDALKVLPEKYQSIIKSRLEGLTIQSIADEYNLSRQRIEQLSKKGLYAIFKGAKNIKPISRVSEDEYKQQFETYNINLDEWVNILHRQEYIYHYLCIRYRKGEKLLPGVVRTEHKGMPKKNNISYAGTIDDVLLHYKAMPYEDRKVLLYLDEEQYKKELLRLQRRVSREIKVKKYISDIKITDYEYQLLRGYLHYAFKLAIKTGIVPDKALFATAITNVAIKVYKDGNFWSNFSKEIEQVIHPNHQVSIGNKYFEILEYYDLARVEQSKYVQNILLHCFVSDNYANSYFEFLFNFYRIDLDRDINRLDTETMRGLMDSICSEENMGRTYMLVQHIGQAMAANRRGATIRIRNHMKLLDKLFWDENYEIKSNHRIYNLMQDWARTSKDVIGEMESYTTGRRRGAKRFQSPHLLIDDETDTLRLVIPSQSIKQIEAEEIFWKISGCVERKLPVELKESVIGYKVLETNCIIPWEQALGSFVVELCTDSGERLKRFNIKNSDVRFFDKDGFLVQSNSIKTGDVTSISKKDQEIKSSAIIDTRIVNDMLITYFNFEYEDILHMPDGHMIIIGKPEITNSIAGKGRISGARCYVDDKEYQLYGNLPFLVLRMKIQKFHGTSITINGKKHKLSDLDYEQFLLNDKTDDVGYYVNLSSYFGDSDGINRIIVDIPGGSRPSWEFVYIHNFNAKFDEAPYVFEPRGTVTFPEHINIKEIEEFCDKEPNNNSYKFIINEINRTLDFVMDINGIDVNISIDVPALFIKNSNGEWDSNRPAPIWYKDLADIIDLSIPYHKFALYMDDVFLDNVGDSSREVLYRKVGENDYVRCDITKFKSYFTGDDVERQLKIRFGEIDTTLFTIIVHSKVISLQAIGDFERNTITINAEISGKSSYYIDVHKDGQLIADKIPFINGNAIVQWDITSGIYSIEVFELENDDSGFDSSEYYSIGVYDQELLNPYDMTGRAFKIVQIEDKFNSDSILALRSVYYVQDLVKTDDNHFYNGMMIAKKSQLMGSEMAAFPVSVYFENLNKPNYVWITFIDEYNDNCEFLYDTRKMGILQEENHVLRPLTCYRRYTMLNEDESVFHVDFISPSEYDYDKLPTMIEFPEGYAGIRFNSSYYKSQKGGFEKIKDKSNTKNITKDFRKTLPIKKIPEGGVLLEKAGFTNRAYLCLKDAGIDKLDDLAKMTEKEILSLEKVGKTTFYEVRKILASYGMKVKVK